MVECGRYCYQHTFHLLLLCKTVSQFIFQLALVNLKIRSVIALKEKLYKNLINNECGFPIKGISQYILLRQLKDEIMSCSSKNNENTK